MKNKNPRDLWLVVALSCALLGATAFGQVTTPQEQFGFELGADYHLANYQQLTAYWQKLAQQSERMTLERIGTTAEGRPMWMAIITSPENHRNLGRYKEISKRLALARDLSDDQARALASEGRAVVWIDGGLHATEVLGAQQLMELVYQMVSRQDAETLRFLDEVILLAACANPDGLDLVADWYMREPEPEKRSTSGVPRLYQKYVGHDNNRDFYMVTQPETEAISRVLFREWFPQIAYNHHQTGPAGTVLFAPPFRDPFNYNLDPLIPAGLDLVGAAMHNRFIAEDKPGATMRKGASYSTWWNGGLRTTQYFHNIIGLLTETIGSPNPMEIPFLLERQLPKNDLPYPIPPQKWRFRQSVDYSITANRAVLDVAARYREHFLFNIYRMGKNSIERGSRDHWTLTPDRLQRVRSAFEADKAAEEETDERGRRRGIPARYYDEVLRSPETRDPRAYVISAHQADFPTAVKFVNTLIRSGIAVHRATDTFQAAGKSHPAGSFAVFGAQAFRPHVLDMFEPQNHPDDIPYPGGPPTPPYDSAGWTLAYQMGIEFDRVLEGFEGPFQELRDEVGPPPGSVSGRQGAAGYLLDPRLNDGAIVVNRLLAAGKRVARLTGPYEAGGHNFPPGAVFIEAATGLEEALHQLAEELGIDFRGVDQKPRTASLELQPVRIGLWDRYGGSMPSGWVRWILEKYEFPFEVVFPPQLDEGDLRDRFDVLIFMGGAIPSEQDSARNARRRRMPDPETIPEDWRARLGNVTVEKTIPALKQFVERGGTLLAVGSSTSIASHFELPLGNPLTVKAVGGKETRLPREKYYIPGSVLRAKADNSHPLAFGLSESLDVYFNNNPVFYLPPRAHLQGVSPVVWFDSAEPLRSGWALGQQYLKDTAAVVAVPLGKGRVFLFGPEITFRAQPHGTFKLLFNGILLAGAGNGALESRVE